MSEKVNFQWVKDQCFSDKEKMISLETGEVLLEHHQKNMRLFLVSKGRLLGYLGDAELENYPIFEATEGKFIGVYSYFSDENLSYSKVVADEHTEVYYYDKPLSDHSEEELNALTPFLISVVVNELYTRQHYAKQMAREKYNDVQRLLKAEKMATLGQMAAGLAHELNNSIGVLDGSLDRLSEFIATTVESENAQLKNAFLQGLQKGQETSSEDARAIRKKFETKIKGLNSSQIRRLAKTGLDPDLISTLVKHDPNVADQIYEFWEIGCTLHDMQIAAKHSAHVVRSVKQLGVNEHQWTKNVDINETINEALVIVKNLTKRVETKISLDPYLPQTEACAGQLVQVWINLIKNAVESMVQSHTENPQLCVASTHDARYITISVTDNGPGIPQSIINRIFEPSFTTKVGGLSFGLGLGLSIVQRIITEHDAQIMVKSQPGNTKFVVKLPIIT